MTTRPNVFQPATNGQIRAAIEANITAALPQYAQLRDTDPLKIQIDAFAGYIHTALVYFDAKLTSVFPATAIDRDLDYIADTYGLTRIQGESDEALRVRVRRAVAVASPIGSVLRNTSDAFAASADVLDVAFAVAANLETQVYLLSNLADPAPTQALKDTVLAFLRDDSRARVDQVFVAPDPTITPYWFAATVSYDSTLTTLAEVTAAVNAAVATTVKAQLRLGESIELSRFYDALAAVPGVTRRNITRLTVDSTALTTVGNIDAGTSSTAYNCPEGNRSITFAVGV